MESKVIDLQSAGLRKKSRVVTIQNAFLAAFHSFHLVKFETFQAPRSKRLSSSEEVIKTSFG
jgi:3-methyladenine DNA glycosylase Tag